MATPAIQQDEKALETKLQQPVTTTAEKDPRLEQLNEGIRAIESQPLPKPERVELPKIPDQPIVNGNEWASLGTALVGVAMMAGAARGNWMSAGQFLNGAIKGYADGHEEMARDNFQKYQAQLKLAMDQQNQRNQEYRELLSDRSKSINELISQYRIMSAEDGRKDQLAAAQTRSLGAMERALVSQELMMERIGLQTRKANESLNPPAAATDYGKMAALQYLITGKAPPMPFGRSPERQAFAKAWADLPKELGVSAEDLIAMQGSNAAVAHAQNKIQEKFSVVDIAENAALKNMDVAIDLSKKLDPTQIPLLNKAALAGEVGTGNTDASRYKLAIATVAREYARASSMNTSASGITDSQLKENESLIPTSATTDQLIGLKNTMQSDMSNIKSAVDEQRQAFKNIASQISQMRETTAGGGQSSAPAAAPKPAVQTATNPQTGEKLQLVNGKWEPVHG